MKRKGKEMNGLEKEKKRKDDNSKVKESKKVK